MGYAGYAPSTCRINDALPPLEQALRGLPLDRAMATLELVEKLVRNTVHTPAEEKFRKIRLTNAKIAEAITNVPGAVEAMLEMGWQKEGEESLILPNGTKLVFEKDVKAILNSQDWFKKEIEKEHKRKMQERKQAGEQDPEKLALRQQLKNDAKERAAQGPITASSKARQLGGNGPNMKTPADLGINQGGG